MTKQFKPGKSNVIDDTSYPPIPDYAFIGIMCIAIDDGTVDGDLIQQKMDDWSCGAWDEALEGLEKQHEQLLDRIGVEPTPGWSITVTNPEGEAVIEEAGLPTLYDAQGVMEEYMSDDDNDGV